MKRSKIDSCPRVTVLVPASTGWGRGVIKGIATFANAHGPWHLRVEAEGEKRPLPRGWLGDGIIARLSTPKVARSILGIGVPVVNVSGIALPGTVDRAPRVCNDLRASGILAARHFLDRGFRHFAYVGPPNLGYVREHRDAFRAALDADGITFAIHAKSNSNEPVQRHDRLVAWLRDLPKPVAILTWNNAQARDVVDGCRCGRMLVPEDVAVLSGDEDQLLCESCLPRLSAICTASEQIGVRAAEILQRMLQRRPLPSTPIHVEPLGIVTRQSTDTLALDDPVVVQALAVIRSRAADGIQVDDVLRGLPVSRRTLERDFQRLLGRSPADEIRRVRLERAKELLASTDLSIPRVARSSGFGTGEYLATIFRQATGMTPLRFRAAARPH